MKINIDDYAYVYIKLALLKQLVMSSEEMEKINSFNDFETLSNFILRYFPNFSISEMNVSSIEQELWNVYFKIIEKIIMTSPEVIQTFLKSLLLKYEIWNIKVVLKGILVNLPLQDRNTKLYHIPSIILERENLYNNLLRVKSIEELKKILSKTPYKEIVEKGLKKYEETSEIFYLVHELDKFYYSYMINLSEFFPKVEKSLIEMYIRYNLDYYNLNLTFRAVYNNISSKIMRPYLIPNGFLLKRKELELLVNSKDIPEYIANLEEITRPYKKFHIIVKELKNLSNDTWQFLSEFYLEQLLFNSQKEIIGDIALTALSRIFLILLHKNIEIQKIVQRSVQISIASQKL
jgi:V/A-type H+/Na+-transporting ATPase subunit C